MVENKVAEAEFEKAKTAVWWDINNCPIPKGFKAEEIAQKITSALHKLNYTGEISIFAFGNMNHIPPIIKNALSATGITLTHVACAPVREDLLRAQIYGDVMWWMASNPPPANMMYICRDDETRMQHEKTERGYNILLAHPQNPPDSLVASAKTTWLWKSLLEEN